MYCRTVPGLAQQFKKLTSAGAQSFQQKFSELRNFLTFSVSQNLRFYEKRTFFCRNIEIFIHHVLPALSGLIDLQMTYSVSISRQLRDTVSWMTSEHMIVHFIQVKYFYSWGS
jgi:hypothetical protein